VEGPLVEVLAAWLPSSALAFVIWPLLAAIAVLGGIALVSPDTFATIAQRGGKWVDTNELLQQLDQPINIDDQVLRYSRLFGAAVLLAALFLGYLYVTRLG
jgi:hypothetical protein